MYKLMATFLMTALFYTSDARSSDQFSVLYNEALQNSHLLAKTSYERDSSKVAVKEAWSRFFPKISIMTTHTNFDSKESLGNVETGEVTGKNIKNEISLDVIFYNRDILLNTKLANVNFEVKEIMVKNIEQSFRMNFTKIYIDTLMAYYRYEDIKSQFKIISTLIEKARSANVDAGIIENLEITKNTIYLRLNGFKTNFQNSIEDLEIITGRMEQGRKIKFLYIPQNDYKFTVNERKKRHLYETSLLSAIKGTHTLNFWGLTPESNSNYSFQMAKLGVDSAKLQLDFSKKLDITVGAKVSRNQEITEISTLDDPLHKNGTAGTFFLKTDLNIFSTRYASQRKRSEYFAANEIRDIAEAEIDKGIKTIVNTLVNNYDSFHYMNDKGSNKSRIEIVNESIRKILDLFNNPSTDVGVILTKIDSLVNYFSLSSQNTDTLKNILISEISLLEITGELTEDYIPLFNEVIFTKQSKVSSLETD